MSQKAAAHDGHVGTPNMSKASHLAFGQPHDALSTRQTELHARCLRDVKMVFSARGSIMRLPLESTHER